MRCRLGESRRCTGGRAHSQCVCLTFDYELFFGQSGTVGRCLLEPTEHILALLSQTGHAATFFVDALLLERLSSVRQEANTYQRVLEQLCRMISRGHRIELHLHSSWLDAKYDNGCWVFPHHGHYRLQSLPTTTVTDLLVRGTELLEVVGRAVSADYKVVAFRAGGWCIQPFGPLKEGFRKAGLVIDSSVAPGLRDRGGVQVFDFSHAPSAPLWRFSDDPCVIDLQGSFWEVPISVYRRTWRDRVRTLYYMKTRREERYGDGTGADGGIQLHSSLFSKLRPYDAILSTDGSSRGLLGRYLRTGTGGLAVVLNHPKYLLKETGIMSLGECAQYRSVLLKDVISLVTSERGRDND